MFGSGAVSVKALGTLGPGDVSTWGLAGQEAWRAGSWKPWHLVTLGHVDLGTCGLFTRHREFTPIDKHKRLAPTPSWIRHRALKSRVPSSSE